MKQDDFECAFEPNRIIAYCDHCGFAIYNVSDALVISANHDLIHKECWSDYAEEHMFEFASSAENPERFDCGF